MVRPSLPMMLVAAALTATLTASPGARAGDKKDKKAAPPTAAPAAAAAPEESRDEVHLSDGPTEAPPKQAGVPFYEELVKKNPEDPEAHQTLAAAFARLGKTDDARREARRAVELAPNSPEAHQALGLIEEGAGNLAVAETELKRAAALDGNVEYRLDVARVLFLQTKINEAEGEYAKVEKDFAKNVDVQFALADAYKELGKYEDAAAAYERALGLAEPGKRVDILVEQARMVADRGNNIQALELLKRAQGESGAAKNPEVQYNLGVIYVRLGNNDAAVAAFKDALKSKPDLTKAQNNLGVALDKAGKHEEAMEAFKGAVKNDARFADALYNLGLVSFKLRKFQDAKGAFEKALAVQPEMADAKFYLGEVYYQLGDSTKALRVYKEALRSNPEDGSSHRRLGDIYLEQGDVSLAVGEYWAAVDADEKDAGNRAQLMRVLLVRNEEGDVRRAVKLGEKGLELDPHSFEVREALAAGAGDPRGGGEGVCARPACPHRTGAVSPRPGQPHRRQRELRHSTQARRQERQSARGRGQARRAWW